MPRFIPCTDLYGNSVWVNFEAVRVMQHFPTHSTPFTKIDFSEGHSVSVKETPQDLGNAANKRS